MWKHRAAECYFNIIVYFEKAIYRNCEKKLEMKETPPFKNIFSINETKNYTKS